MYDIQNHRRVLNTFTGPVERIVLRWLAARLPRWVTPDVLTGIGVLGGLVAFLGYWFSAFSPAYLWLASLGFAINWFGDSLDGTVARFRHIERPVYGYYIDHVVDAYISIMIFLGLGLSPYVRFDLACLALIAYLLLCILVYLRTSARGEFVISYGRLGPTELRLIAVIANTLVFFIGNPLVIILSIQMAVYDWLLMVIIAIMAIISLATTIHQAIQLSDYDSRIRQEKAKSAAGITSGRKVASQD